MLGCDLKEAVPTADIIGLRKWNKFIVSLRGATQMFTSDGIRVSGLS